MQVVGIGASVGGIEAFRLFFEKTPSDSGLSFVVVLHLSASRKSMLAEIIARWTAMPVSEAADGDLVEPNRILVVPPGHVAAIRQGRLHLRSLRLEAPRELTPIDDFFDSLAQDCGENAVGIVLSGTGHDGSLGLKAIKARGGLTLTQGSDGSAPQHEGMPRSAIATGVVDLIIPVQDMLRVLLAMRPGRAAPAQAPPPDPDTEALRLAVCEILHLTTVDLPAVNTPQFDWGMNKMGRRAKPVAPIFQPEVPARAISFAATHKRQEVWVGFPTVKAILANRIAPALTDRYLAKTGYSGQLSDEKLPADAPANLFQPVPGSYDVHGRFDSRSRPHSWQMFTDRHRAVFWAAAAASVAAGPVALAKQPEA
ncbi:chemotaxis protein CheB [Acidisphaera rubrifaciens]|uniref:protein-glutamate methylesterase n=1 Tax=Acidisphaera rubrifaciens HS-AP3 TaxID=1231350 RepID=A0A0D6P804_9PROT|nr:chemotaxis protein CheB [Acidisphaera rubrifaciens]GAN77471.1 short-chain dehydrogenase/reductase SDR [Acidisphaera rubrifaciens HS-AP3]